MSDTFQLPSKNLPNSISRATLALLLGIYRYNVQILIIVHFPAYLPRTGDLRLGYGTIDRQDTVEIP